jgi:hypothetical protein
MGVQRQPHVVGDGDTGRESVPLLCSLWRASFSATACDTGPWSAWLTCEGSCPCLTCLVGS